MPLAPAVRRAAAATWCRRAIQGAGGCALGPLAAAPQHRASDAAGQRRGVLVFRPAPGSEQKHTFDPRYLTTPNCQHLIKVRHQNAVTLKAGDNGQHVPFAARSLRRGEVLEHGVLREVSTDSPFGIYEGLDFQPRLPGIQASFVASGLTMFYPRANQGYNTELQLTPTEQPGALEFNLVATEDVPEGAPLFRRDWGHGPRMAPYTVRHADVYNLSESDVDRYLEQRRQLDLEVAQEAGMEPDTLHEDAIREHVRLTREGQLPPIGGDGGCQGASLVVLPHPSWSGYGAFAIRNIRAGEVVEWGLQRRLDGFEGNTCPYVFTWNPDGRRRQTDNVWTTGSGSSMFYNSDYPPNVRLYRLFSAFRYLVVARRDIQAGEELVHLYASSSWRKVFVSDDCLPKVLPVQEV